MSSYTSRLDRIEAAIAPAETTARSLPVIYIDYDETAEQAADRYVTERGLPRRHMQRILAEGLFVRFVMPAAGSHRP
jgi:hypothetical protein